uniref:HTH tetR-type domain-containing protein n=1 Tax=Mycobacterium riyadhense TaxID=486698 RepID=A0A653EWF6_9MYCO|nr:hypothetical protein BIN_B_03974 [Mycobacterium riyadhense]
MLSPRLRHPDLVIDFVEALVGQSGLDALTIRALTTASGFSNGAIYRTFGSRGGLIGRMWIRAESRFLELMKGLIAQAHNPFDAAVAAAETSLVYLQRYPKSAAVLFTVRREEALSLPMSIEIGDQLRALDDELVAIMSLLAKNLWKRNDAETVDLVAACILDLPKWVALRNMRLGTYLGSVYLRATIRAILEVGPPPLVPHHEVLPEEPAYRVLL